jgi:hypothetical protein
MPKRSTAKRAREDLREGKSPSTAAGEFVHEEIEHVREGKHGARSPQQAIAIGLSKARRAGVPLRPPKKGKAKEGTRKSAKRAYKKGQTGTAGNTSPRASRARKKALKKESRSSASHGKLATHSRSASRGRTSADRSAAAKKAAKTKGKAGRQAAARKAARTRARNARAR